MPAKPHVDRVLFAGLLALFAIPGHAADPWSNAQPMTVIMVDDRFQPDHLTFHAGTTYELRLENRGKDLHEFTTPEFFHATTVRDKRLLANGGIEVVVQPGRSARVLLLPRVKGEYKLTCADHDWDGMIGTITVE